MATLDQRYTINGLIDTTEPVWENLQKIADACSSWITYDTHTGRYAVVINQAGASVRSFTDDNILGAIQVSGTGLTNLYNAIEVEYPNSDIRDQNHYIRLELPASLRNAYEPDNTLSFSTGLINNQVQASLVASILLRQSRVDKTVTFVTDYTNIDLSAGDLIDITTDMYGWTNKVFRIMRMRELEGTNGSLQIEINCLEYEADVYSEDDLSEFLIGGPSGVRSLNSIGVPGTPTVATVTIDSLPAQQVTSTVPAGIVEQMEFWAGNVDITGNIATTTFNFYGGVKPTDAATFSEGANAVFTTTELRDGTWSWKTRGINALARGPFSDEAGNVDYTRTQVADAILDTTPIITSNGSVVTASISSAVSGSGIESSLAGTSFLANNVISTNYIEILDLGNNQVSVTANTNPGNAWFGVNNTIYLTGAAAADQVLAWYEPYGFDVTFDQSSNVANTNLGAVTSAAFDQITGLTYTAADVAINIIGQIQANGATGSNSADTYNVKFRFWQDSIEKGNVTAQISSPARKLEQISATATVSNITTTGSVIVSYDANFSGNITAISTVNGENNLSGLRFRTQRVG